MYRKRRCLSVMAAGTRIFGMNLAVFGRINAVFWGAIQSRCQNKVPQAVRVGPLLYYVSGSDARAFGMQHWPLDCNSLKCPQ